MRPKILDPLYQNIRNISGFGPYYTSLLKNLVGDRYKDLLLHMPTSFIKRKLLNNVLEYQINQKVILTGIVDNKWTTYKKPKMSIATIKFSLPITFKTDSKFPASDSTKESSLIELLLTITGELKSNHSKSELKTISK